MATGTTNSQKDQKGVTERLLLDEQLLVHVNPRCDGVELPPHLSENKTVTLRLSRYFRGSLVLDEDKITAELLFGDQYHMCILPWRAIWGASSVRGEEFVWAESAPDQVIELFMSQKAQATQSDGGISTSRPISKVKRATSHLTRVK